MRGIIIPAVIAAIILITAGCAHYGAVEQNFGNSYNSAKQGQILNAAASNNLAPVTGLRGSAAEATMKKYTDSFSASSEGQQTPQGFAMTPIVPTEGAGKGQNVYGK